MTIRISARSRVEPFHAMDVLAEANRLRAEGRDIVSMAVGQPSAPAPRAVLEAAERGLRDGRIAYTDALGMAPLREAIAQHYDEHYGLKVPVDRIVVTTGSSAGFNLAFLAMFDAGERVAVTSPGYPAYRNILGALGLEAIELPLHDAGHLTPDMLREAHGRTPLAGVLFASPANPTGAIIPEDDLRQIIETCRELGISAISDEIYHRLNFVGRDLSALSFGDDVAVINSFSKYYCMTGWRIGWMVLPADLVRPVERIQQSLYISAPELSQMAAVAAFSATEELEVVKASYREARALLLDDLPKLGFRLAAPMDGAFYAYCEVTAHTNDSMDFARRMIQEADVAATPGHDFDISEGNRFMRLSYAGGPEHARIALERLGKWLNR